MADKNHVKAFVHSTGSTMTWAMNYYKAYKFELSQKPADDMILDEVVDLAANNSKVTFTDVLSAILAGADAGYSEFLIVAHGSPKGLIMPMGPNLHSADKDNLPAMTEMAGLVTERDHIGSLADKAKQIAEWTRLLGRLSGSKLPGGATWGLMSQTQLAGINSDADGRAWLETICPQVNGRAILKDPDAMKLLTLRNRVAARKIKRVEVRACNLGGDADGMKALREFLNVSTVLAPYVKTFYAQVSPTLFVNDAHYITWLNRNAPWLLTGRPDPAGTRTYLGDSLFLKMGDRNTTPMAVLKLLQPSFQTCAALAGKTGNYAMVQLLIRNNFDMKSTSSYTAGSFFIGGLDPVAGRTASNPPPAAANGKAFIVAPEPEYRLLIASNP